VKGRSFTAHDDGSDAPLVVIINQAMARHRFPGEDPLGKRLSFDGGEHWAEIVGIAGDVKEYGLNQPVLDEIYGALRTGMVNRLVVRTAADPKAVAPMVRAAVHELDPLVAIDQVDTVERAEYESLASPRVMTFLLGIFAGLAVLISASGLAAVMALAVSQRTREIGVRMALGARRGAIVGMVVRQGLTLAIGGAALGLAGAAALTNLLASLLYGTSPTDLPTFAGVLLLFLMVAAVACFIPARQVTAIDPLIALRQD
jgi:putative ABC transport system permease protein